MSSKRIGKQMQTVAKRKTPTKTSLDNDGSSKRSKTSHSQGNPSTEDCVKRDSNGKLVFKDFPDFKPNLTPKQVMQLGSFGGTYFRPIKSGVTKQSYKGVWSEFSSDWFSGLDIDRQVASPDYDTNVNTYQVKCGGSLEMWESSGWINKLDPYGWFQWYCRFYLGRRCDDDQRQVRRWLNCAGPKGRWKNNLIAKCVRQGKRWDDRSVSPVVRQVLQHWAYVLNEKDFNTQRPHVKQK